MHFSNKLTKLLKKKCLFFKQSSKLIGPKRSTASSILRHNSGIPIENEYNCAEFFKEVFFQQLFKYKNLLKHCPMECLLPAYQFMRG